MGQRIYRPVWRPLLAYQAEAAASLHDLHLGASPCISAMVSRDCRPLDPLRMAEGRRAATGRRRAPPTVRLFHACPRRRRKGFTAVGPLQRVLQGRIQGFSRPVSFAKSRYLDC